MFSMNRPTGPEKPKDVAVRLRQVGLCAGGPINTFPQWFQDEWSVSNGDAWKRLLTEAADEMEQMQKLNGKLYSTLYP